jgi:hypothetical protein
MYNRYLNVNKIRQTNFGETYYTNNIYPDIPYSNEDNYVITTMGDRLDLLALDFYGDDSLWWIISSANNLPGDSLYPPPGMQLRIPVDVKQILNSYKLTNISR